MVLFCFGFFTFTGLVQFELHIFGYYSGSVNSKMWVYFSLFDSDAVLLPSLFQFSHRAELLSTLVP